MRLKNVLYLFLKCLMAKQISLKWCYGLQEHIHNVKRGFTVLYYNCNGVHGSEMLTLNTKHNLTTTLQMEILILVAF
jgi:hypothetical protein